MSIFYSSTSPSAAFNGNHGGALRPVDLGDSVIPRIGIGGVDIAEITEKPTTVFRHATRRFDLG